MQTPKLALPLIAAGQAQKHVTVNESLFALDSLVQIGVKSSAWSAPPPSPMEGDSYIVPGSASGPWTGKDGSLAVFQDGAWLHFPPRLGWLAYVQDSDRLLVHNGVAWSGGASLRANDIVLRVPEDAPTIQAALDVLAAYRFTGVGRGIVDIAPGVLALAAPVTIGQADLGLVVLRGRTAPAAIVVGDITGVKATDEIMLRTRYPVVIEAGSAGAITMSNGGQLEIENIAFVRTGSGGAPVGIAVSQGSRAALTRVAVLGFTTGIAVSGNASVRLKTSSQTLHQSDTGVSISEGSQLIGTGLIAGYNATSQASVQGAGQLRLSGGALLGGTTGLFANEAAVCALTSISVSGQSGNGIYAQNGSVLSLSSITVGAVGIYPIANLVGSRVVVYTLTLTGTSKTVFSSGGSVCQQFGPHTGAPVFSPVIGAVGNSNAVTL